MMMTNGFGAVLGSSLSGIFIQKYFTYPDSSKDWHSIWISFALYAGIIAILFVVLFKHKHDVNALKNTHPEPLLSVEDA